MASPERLRRLYARAARALGPHQVGEAVAKVRAIVGGNIPASEPEAQSAWEKLRNGEDGDAPNPRELAALEIVIRLLRPVPLSRNGDLDDLPNQGAGHNLYPPELKDQWSAFRRLIQPLLYSVGRVETGTGKHIGTGFLVGPQLLATNRHVLDMLSFGSEELQPGQAQVCFQGEARTSKVAPGATVGIEGVAAVHPILDLALLRLPPQDRPCVVLSPDAPPAEGRRIAAIGYPARDEDRNPLFMNAIFGGVFGVKRAALGEVLDGTGAPNIFHDCSTLGGNSGSPLFCLETARVVGVHRSGFFMYRNEGVDAPSLKRLIRSSQKTARGRNDGTSAASGAGAPKSGSR